MVNYLVQRIVILSALFVSYMVNNKCAKNANSGTSHYYLHSCSHVAEAYQPFIITTEVYCIAIHQANPVCYAVAKSTAHFHENVEHHQADKYFSRC